VAGPCENGDDISCSVYCRNFLTNCGTTSFSRKSLLLGVTEGVCEWHNIRSKVGVVSYRNVVYTRHTQYNGQCLMKYRCNTLYATGKFGTESCVTCSEQPPESTANSGIQVTSVLMFILLMDVGMTP
jgi:hypothetical protein